MRLLSALLLLSVCNLLQADEPERDLLKFEALPDLPNDLGVAGPFAGMHNDALIVAGGANFPRPVWDNDKVWLQTIHVLERTVEDGKETLTWHDGGKLPRPLAYGAAVSTIDGVICMGGNDADNVYKDVFRLTWDRKTRKLTSTPLPSLPKPCAFGYATLVNRTIYLAGGQNGTGLDSAMANFWKLDLSQQGTDAFGWEKLAAPPWPSRALNLTVHQHNGYDDCIYVMSGRRQNDKDVEFLRDVWEFTPRTGNWRQRKDAPVSIMAGTGIGVGQSHIMVLGGADGTLFHRTDELRDEHPGFPKKAWAYHTITNNWTSAGSTPRNHVTTIAVRWNDHIVVPSGEVRPRVRSAKIWKVSVVSDKPAFGAMNYLVLGIYLLGIVGVGFYFARRNRNTEQYFRGGGRIPWWAAGCSIFATMLSSLTFTGLPAKSYAQDWVYMVGNLMIPVVAVIAVYVALPFFRRIDATSAYEYLERRFSRGVRLFGSLSFTLFHVFRMAVVMSLTGLALAVATPLTGVQSVLLMGVLSIVYCTIGGIEAVIWTDTIQTVVLMGGALLAFGLLVAGVDGGLGGFISDSAAAGKFRMANLLTDPTSSQIALWVIIVGGIGQNLSSYTADQAVVQRYMTTADQKKAARSIWMNGFLTIPSTLLFLGVGTALFAFYRSHPERLDPTITTDQIFPLFIAREMPVGLAGLIVAGVFAAAQSTVSTSMNSISTTIVTDFLRPRGTLSEAGLLKAARVTTLLCGILGTAIGLIFVNPEIKSLFDAFLKVIGLFMGVLGGLFVLGALTRRASAGGAMVGALVGAGVMFLMWQQTSINGYLYTTCGITTCVVVGFVASMVLRDEPRDLTGLTIHTLGNASKNELSPA